jgi:chloride channel protein, CIC family
MSSGDNAGPRFGSQAVFALAVSVTAVSAALFAVAWNRTLSAFYRHVLGGEGVVAAFQHLPLWARLVAPAIGGFAMGLVARFARRHGPAHGVGGVMEAAVLGRVHLSVEATMWRVTAAWLALAGGASVGREGPLIQMGGALGQKVGDLIRVPSDRARVLVAAGAAAGFAAAYNTPFAAVLFVLEVVVAVAAREVVTAAMAGAAFATMVSRALGSPGPIYGARTFTLNAPHELVFHLLLGVVAGPMAVAFRAWLGAAERGFARLPFGQPWRGALGGLVVGALAMFAPAVTGNGHQPLNQLLDGRFPTAALIALLLAKALATGSSVGSGTPGGIFTPTLLLGGGVGLLGGQALAGMGLVSPASVGSYALVGMAAFTAATTHAPLLAAVMIFELSGDYAVVLPLVAACATATLIAARLRPDSVYVEELRRRGLVWEVTLEGRRVRPDVEVDERARP